MTKRKRPEDKLPLGRPLEYTKEMGDYICELTSSSGYGLMKLCSLYPELPNKMTINRWRHRLPEFRAQYANAKIEQADLLAEECLDIADDSSQDTTINKDGFEVCDTEWINRCRLRIDTRKWLASKLLPKQYGAMAEEKKTVSESIVEKLIDRLIE